MTTPPSFIFFFFPGGCIDAATIDRDDNNNGEEAVIAVGKEEEEEASTGATRIRLAGLKGALEALIVSPQIRAPPEARPARRNTSTATLVIGMLFLMLLA